MIASHYRGLAWCWVAMKTASSPEWRVVSVVVRPIYADVPEIHLVGQRVAISTEHLLAIEASEKWLETLAGRIDINTPPIAYTLLGDRIDAFWVASGETWAQGRRATFPEYQVTWVIDGASNLVSSGELWEPLEDSTRHFVNAWAVIYPYVLGLPYKPGVNVYMNGAAAVRLPYPVMLSEAKTSESEFSVRVSEDIPGRAAGHSVHVSYLTSAEQAVPTTQETVVDSPRLFVMPLTAPPVHWSATLISPDGIRRDFKERTDSAAPATVITPYPSLGVILGKQSWPNPDVRDAPSAESVDTGDAAVSVVGADQPSEVESVAPDFSRISDPESADLLTERWNEAVLGLRSGASLSAITMMGSLLEGALLQMAMRRPDEANRTKAAPREGNKPRPWSQWRLSDLINVAVQAKWITVDLQAFSEVLRDYRNLIHPWESQAKAFHPTRDSAAICWEITRRVVDQLIAYEARSQKGGHPSTARKLARLPRRSKMTPGSKNISDYVGDQRR
jgi:hypothetical protein